MRVLARCLGTVDLQKGIAFLNHAGSYGGTPWKFELPGLSSNIDCWL